MVLVMQAPPPQARVLGSAVSSNANVPSAAAAKYPGLSVARIAVDSSLPHLDRPFDYHVPAELSEAAAVGCRVRVRFAGRLLDGWVLERLPVSDHAGKLADLERVVGSEPVLTVETAALFRSVADRWAGSFADVVRLGVPARHARAEAGGLPVAAGMPDRPDAAGWSPYRAGGSYLDALVAGRPARAVWNALPGEDWPRRIAEAVAATLASGRSAIVVVPDARDAARVDAALTAQLPTGSSVLLSAELGPQARYRRWLAVRRGMVRAVVGPRSAVFAPVSDLGLIVVWDDGDDLHAEPRAPYPHARDVAVMRTAAAGASFLIAGFARTAEAQLLLDGGWAQPIIADRTVIRSTAPRVVAVGDDAELARDPAATSARLPAVAFRAARESLQAGRPVLVQVPRRGYAPSLACLRDQTPARCGHCGGPLAVAASHAVAGCRWCGRSAAEWRCPSCGGQRMRVTVVGSARTAEELGRAFPGVITRTSSGDSSLTEIPPGPALVIATPGAEPTVPGGYGAALLLDGWASLARPDLRAAEETLRRWMNAAALLGPQSTVVVGADASIPVVQALIRWDPAGHASRELADRQALNFPPVSRWVSLTGQPADVDALLDLAHLPPSTEKIGSVDLPAPAGSAADQPTSSRLLLRCARPDGLAVAAALRAAATIRSAKRSGGSVRIQFDPQELW